MVVLKMLTGQDFPFKKETFFFCCRRNTEVRSIMRALDWARAGIKTAQLNDSSRSPYIFIFYFSSF